MELFFFFLSFLVALGIHFVVLWFWSSRLKVKVDVKSLVLAFPVASWSESFDMQATDEATTRRGRATAPRQSKFVGPPFVQRIKGALLLRRDELKCKRQARTNFCSSDCTCALRTAAGGGEEIGSDYTEGMALHRGGNGIHCTEVVVDRLSRRWTCHAGLQVASAELHWIKDILRNALLS